MEFLLFFFDRIQNNKNKNFIKIASHVIQHIEKHLTPLKMLCYYLLLAIYVALLLNLGILSRLSEVMYVFSSQLVSNADWKVIAALTNPN